MSHWHTVGFLAEQHRGDLAREAAGSTRLKLARDSSPDQRSHPHPVGRLNAITVRGALLLAGEAIGGALNRRRRIAPR